MRVATGFAFLIVGAGPRLWVALLLKRHGQATARVWRRLLWAPIAWLAVVILVGAINPTAGGVAGALVVAVFGAVSIVLLVRGVWRIPTALRLIGDPEAWRGKRHPYWETRSRED